MAILGHKRLLDELRVEILRLEIGEHVGALILRYIGEHVELCVESVVVLELRAVCIEVLSYGPLKMSFLERTCYAFLSLPSQCFATIPQLCLVNDISLYTR